MSSPFAGIDPEQGPPLFGPVGFFLLAPLALGAAGALLLEDPSALVSRAAPRAMALTHLGTLGFLGAVMLGALYQMLPVVAGAPVPWPRLAHAVQVGLAVGAGALVYGFASGAPVAFTVVERGLSVTLLLFLFPVGIALARAPGRDASVNGVRLALLGLAALATLGILLARTHGGHPPAVSTSPAVLLYAHAALGGLVWVGGLLTPVSWKVVPMFYLTAEVPRVETRTSLGLVLATLIGVPTTALLGLGPEAVAWAAAPGALAVLALHPLATARRLAGRRRKRADPSVRFWEAGLACGPLVLLLLAVAHVSPAPRWPVLVGWTAIFGWAGIIMHGMLTRIVPFLVWFHRYSALVGRVPTPPMRRLLPARLTRAALGVHGLTLALGWAAIGGSSTWLARAAGLGLIATGALLAAELAAVLRHLRPSAPG